MRVESDTALPLFHLVTSRCSGRLVQSDVTSRQPIAILDKKSMCGTKVMQRLLAKNVTEELRDGAEITLGNEGTMFTCV